MKLTAILASVAHVGPAGYVVLAGPGVVAACLLTATLARKHDAVARALALAALFSYMTFAAAAGAIYVGTRWRFIDLLLAPKDDAPWLILSHLEEALATETFAGAASLALVPLLAVTLALAWARARGDAALPVAVAASVGALVWAVALLALADARVFERMAYGPCEGEECYATIVGSSTLTDLARAAVLGVAAMGAFAIAFAARGASALSWSGRAACVACLAVGALAFVATRGAAEDARHPASWAGESPVTLSAPGERWPAATDACGPVPDAPLVVVRGDVTEVDGLPTSDLGAVLRSKLALLVSIHPHKPPPATVMIGADADAPASAIAGPVEAARSEGFTDVRVVRRLPSVALDTRTVGRVTRKLRYCATMLSSAAPAGTWDDWAR
jgi:hypothetical protein